MRLPLATSIQSRDGTLSKDSRPVNVTIEQIGESAEVYRRPGTLIYSSDISGVPKGIFCLGGIFAVAGSTLSQLGDTFSSATITDTATALPSVAKWSTLCYGDKFVTVAGGNVDATTKAAYSTDGVTWVAATLPTSSRWVTCATDGTRYVAISSSSGGAIVTAKSSNGTTWSAGGGVSLINVTSGKASCFFLGYFYVVGAASDGSSNFRAIRSTDGTTWATAATVSTPAIYTAFNCKASNGYIVAWTTDVASAFWVSRDGVNWTQKTSPEATSSIRDIAYSDDLDLWVFIVYDTVTGTHGYSTSDFTTFAQSAAFTAGTYWQNLVWTGTCFFSSGDAGIAKVATSFNGTTWTETAVTARNRYAMATSGDGTSVTVEYDGRYATKFEITSVIGVTTTYAMFAPDGDSISATATSGSASTQYKVFKSKYAAWTLTGGTITQVSDADYPEITVPGIVYLDGYFFVMDENGTIYNSDLEDPTSWNALNYITAEIEPEGAIAIAKHQNYVVAFKETTIELFYDAANASGSPLSRLSNVAIQVGCASGYSLAPIDGGLFFLSSSKSREISVHYFPADQLSPIELATPAIKRIFTVSDTANARAWGGRIGGHSYFVVTLPTEGITLAYDLQSKVWAQWTWLTAQASKSITALSQSGGVATATCASHGYSDGDPVTIAGATPSGYNGAVNITYVDANTFTYLVSSPLSTPATGTITATGYTSSYFPFSYFISCGQKDFVQHSTNGNLYEISFELNNDNGVPIDCLLRTPKFDNGNNDRKSMSVVKVVGDQVTGTLMIRYSDDDYQTFSTYRHVSLAQENPQVRRLGQFRHRSMDFRFTDSGKLHLRAVDLEV